MFSLIIYPLKYYTTLLIKNKSSLMINSRVIKMQVLVSYNQELSRIFTSLEIHTGGEGHNPSQKFTPFPYQGKGARGIGHQSGSLPF